MCSVYLLNSFFKCVVTDHPLYIIITIFLTLLCQTSGTTDFVMGGIDAITSQCSAEINRNVTLLNSEANSEERDILNQLLPRLCPSECNDQGDCVNGKLILVFLF